jgi:hypothetical protein
MAFTIPRRLATSCSKTPDRVAWLARLPNVVHDLEERRSLTLGDPFDGQDVSCAWVAPTRLADGAPAVLVADLLRVDQERVGLWTFARAAQNHARTGGKTGSQNPHSQ